MKIYYRNFSDTALFLSAWSNRKTNLTLNPFCYKNRSDPRSCHQNRINQSDKFRSNSTQGSRTELNGTAVTRQRISLLSFNLHTKPHTFSNIYQLCLLNYLNHEATVKEKEFDLFLFLSVGFKYIIFIYYSILNYLISSYTIRKFCNKKIIAF